MKSQTWFAGLLTIATVAVAAPGDSSRDAEMARLSTAALVSVRQAKQPTYKEAYDLVMEERFEEFEARTRTYEAGFAQDPLQEAQLWKLYAPPSLDPAYLAKLDKWVATRPSYVAFTVRGRYYVARGYHLRGDKYAQETPRENFDRMDASHRLARSDLTEALRLHAGFLPAYGGLLHLEMARGSVAAADKLIAEATAAHPATFHLRHTYLRNLHPRWGGSYAAMESYAKAQVSAAKLNPRIWSLQGEAPAERGRSAMLNKNYETAVSEYTAALSYGDRMEFLLMRAYSYWSLRRYEDSLKDYERYLELNPDDKQVADRVACARNQMAGGNCVYDKHPGAE